MRIINDNFPIPNVDEIIDHSGNSKYFSTFNLASGFHQTGMHPKEREKTAFSTLDGPYKIIIGNGCFVYIEDVIVNGNTINEHNDNLKKYFKD